MEKINIKVIVATAAVGASLCGFAGGGTTVSLSPLGNSGGAAQPAAANDGDTVKVQGRGVGMDKTAALKDAYRDAVERAVGRYVDAEVAVANDQIIKKQILTQSNAYITDYKEIEEKRLDGGFVQLRILATVKKQALTKKLSGVMPTQTVALNTGLQNVHAQLVTKEKRAEDAAALLKNALNGIDPMKSLMVASIRPETQKIITADDASGGGRHGRKSRGSVPAAGSVTLRYLFEVKLDRAKYFAEFVPNLKKVLEQISLTPPKELRLMELMQDLTRSYGKNERAEMLAEFMNGKTIEGASGLYDQNANGGGHDRLFGDYAHLHGSFIANLDPIHFYSISWQGDNWVWQFGMNRIRPKSGGGFSWKIVPLHYKGFASNYRKDKVYFAMITTLNADCSNGRVTMYELDKSVIPVLNEWRKGLIDKEDHGYEQKTTNYNIILLDKDGNEIGVYPWNIPNGILMNVKFAEILGAGMVYAAPFVGCFGEKLIQWRDFILEKDQLAKIASVKIELAD